MGAGRLRLTDARWNTIKEFVSEPLALFDGKSGKILDINRQFQKKFGYTKAASLHLTFGMLSAGDQAYAADHAMVRFAKAVQTGDQFFSWQCKTRAAEMFWANIVMRRAVMRRHVCVTVQIQDIETGKVHDEYAEAKRLLQTSLVENAPFGLYYLRARDNGFEFVFVSDRFCEITGLERDTLLRDSQRCYDIVPENLREDFRRLNEETIQANGIFRWNGPVVGHGKARWVQIESYPMVTSTGVRVWIGVVLDTSEQRQLESAMEKRIVALTRPLGETEAISFEEMFRITEIQEIQDLFAQATGVASVIARPDGTPITTPSKSTRLCYGVIRKTEQGQRNCFHSDAVLGRHHPSGPVVQPCLGCGLWDAGASITVGGRHVANWMIGQVRNETQTEDHMREYAHTIGADEEQLIEAFREVPTMSREHFDDIARALFALANQLSTMAYQNIQQARFIAERKQAENALRKSEERLRGITQNLPGMVFQFFAQPDGKIGLNYVSESSQRYLGIDSTHLEGILDRFGNGIVEQDRVAFYASIQRAVETVTPWHFETSYRKPDGTLLSLLGLSQPRWVNKELVFDGLILDVTKQRQAEEKYTLILKTLMDGYILLASDGRILDVNDAYSRMTGYSREELLQRKISDMTTRSPETVAAEFDKMRATGFNRFETTHKKRDGGLIEFDAGGQALPESDQFFVFYRDITEQKRSKQEFERLAQLQQTILDALSAGLSFVKERKHVWTNKAFCSLFGYKSEELRDMRTEQFYADKDDYNRVGREGYPALADGKVYSTESLMRRKDGTQCWCNIVGKALDPSDLSIGTIWMLSDITEKKAAEQALKDSEATLHATIESMNDGVLVVSRDGLISHANSYFQTMFSVPESVITARDDEVLLHMVAAQAQDPDQFLRLVREIYRSSQPTEDIVHLADGRIFERRSFPLRGGPAVKGRAWVFRDVTERRRTEETLAQSQALLRESQRVANIGCWEFDLATSNFTWNEEASRIYGMDAQASHLSFDEYVSGLHPDDRESAIRHFAQVKKTGVFTDYEVRVFRPDGNIRHLLVIGSIQRDDAGRPYRSFGIVQDLTDRKRAEERYRTIIQTAMEGFAMHDAEGRILDVNDAISTISGYSREEALQMNVADLQVDPGAFLRNRQTLTNDPTPAGRRFEAELQHKDGHVLQVEISVKHIHTDADYFFLFLRDITEQKAAQLALKESQERLRLFMDSAMDAFTIWDEHLRLTEINKAALSYLAEGIVKESILGMPLQHFLPNLDTARYLRVMETGVPFAEDLQTDLGGTPRWHFSRVFRVGKGIGFVTTDFTARKEAEEAIRRVNEELERRVAERTAELQRASKEMESFAYSVSHDLRAPLRAIDGYTRILLEDYAAKLDENGKRVCGVICSETQRMDQLVNDILTLSRLGRALIEHAPVDLAELTKDVLADQLTTEQKERIAVTTAPLPIVQGDRRLLRQLLVNLLSNAVKFSSRQEHPSIEIGSTEENGKTVFFVRDNGAGFDMQYATKLFGVFQRLHSEREFPGTGVGLAIVQRIVTRHGGRVWAEAEVDKGATFYFTLPTKEAPA